jgi:prophage antirepressor-like protein
LFDDEKADLFNPFTERRSVMSKSTPTSVVTPFVYESTAIRTIKEADGIVWFVAKDVCDVLGYSNPSKTISDHLDDDERSNKSLDRGGSQLLINESGLYTLILRSNKPEAKPFRKWVTSEVLPAIRKTGTYTVPTITPAQQRQVQRLVIDRAWALAGGVKPGKGQFQEVYRAIKDQFLVAKYTQVPQARFDELVTFLGGTLGAPTTARPMPDSDRKEAWNRLCENSDHLAANVKHAQDSLHYVMLCLLRMRNCEALLMPDLFFEDRREKNLAKAIQ